MKQKFKTNSNHETLALVLLVSGLTGFFLWFWQIVYIPKHLAGYLNLSFSIFDFYLAYAFFKIKLKAKKLLFLRIFLGLLGWFIVFYFIEAQYSLIWVKIGILLSLAILASNKLKKPSILAIIALIFIFVNAYFTSYYITYKQNTLIKLKKYGKNNYTSQEYNFRIEVPSNWKIIMRENFVEIKEKFLEAEAEIALFTKDGQSFCLVIPDKLNKYLQDYTLGEIQKALIKSLKMRKVVKINKAAPFISSEKGFQIQYTDIIEGIRQDYIIICLNKDNTTIRFIGWTLGDNQEKIYAEIKNIAKSVTIKKK